MLVLGHLPSSGLRLSQFAKTIGKVLRAFIGKRRFDAPVPKTLSEIRPLIADATSALRTSLDGFAHGDVESGVVNLTIAGISLKRLSVVERR
jgi:hypothetical protein